MEEGSVYRARLALALPGVRETIAEAARVSGRLPQDVRLVAVSKGHPLEAVGAALDAGILDLGENRLEELEAKVAQAGRDGVCWHFIGNLQSRKVARVLEVSDLIHSVDSLSLCERISRMTTGAAAHPVPVLLQVNTSGEASKGGFGLEDARDGLARAASLPGVRVRGLMTMAPFVDDERVLRTAFTRLRDLLELLRGDCPDVGGELSMGMTNDLRFAVEEGSTLVRVGTALFGERAA
jgi:pyridoxal phosphate enzyme (YggS family)